MLLRAGVSDGPRKLLFNDFRFVREIDDVRFAQGLAHFFGWLQQAHDPRGFGEEGFHGFESFAESSIEFFGYIVGQFEMLNLIFTDRNGSRFVQQNVYCLQNWIREEPHVGRMSARDKIFVLCHPLKRRYGCQYVKYPSEFRVFWQHGLNEKH